MNRSYKLFLAFVVSCISFAACKSKAKNADKPKANPPVIVDVMIASAQPISNIIEANGTVLAGEYVELHPEVSGRLTYLRVPEGSFISQGTVLAKINDADLRAQIGKSKVQLDLAIKTVERYKVLLDVSGINQSDYDLAVNAVNGYRADIAYTQSLIDKTVIKAPFSGTAGLRQVSPGAYVTPASVIATLQQTSQVKIDFTLPDVYGNVIKTGSVVNVALDGGKRSTATIVAIEPGANTDTRNIKVRAVLQSGSVNPGAFVKVYIDEGKNRTSIKVPTNAIIPNDQNNQLVVVKNGIANFVNVKTGNREANTVEILSGLNVGDSVVVTGVLFAKPKAKVKVRGVKKINELEAKDSTQGTDDTN